MRNKKTGQAKERRLFGKLRGKMEELDIDQPYMAAKLKISSMSVSRRMTGKQQWCLDEMYAVMDLIDEPYEKISEYFPKNGGIGALKMRAS